MPETTTGSKPKKLNNRNQTMKIKEHGKTMLVTLGWFVTGLIIVFTSICTYAYLTGLFNEG